LIFKEIEKCVELIEVFEERSIIFSKNILIKPNDNKIKIIIRNLVENSKMKNYRKITA